MAFDAPPPPNITGDTPSVRTATAPTLDGSTNAWHLQRLGVARLRALAASQDPTPARVPWLSPNPTARTRARALGCDAAVEGGACGCDGSCEGAAKGVWRTRPREQGTRDGTASRTRSESKIGEVAPRVYPTRRITRVRLGRETSGRPSHVASPMMRPMPNDVFICAVLGHPDMGTRPEVLPGGW